MIKIKVLSDQFNNWSEYHERKDYSNSSSKTKDTPAKTAESPICPSWVFNRALQALWKTWVQVRTWARSWTQILSIREQAWAAASDGLCPPGLPGKSKGASGQLPEDKSHYGRALRDQPGTFASKGKVLARAPPSLQRQNHGNISDRCGRDSHSLYKYARRSIEIRLGSFFSRGDKT